MPGGLLFIYSEPGSAVTAEEFNDWYDNEHVPTRLPIPGFQTWSRWVAADGKTPGYAAIYDIDSPTVASTPPYTDLAKTRSEREKALIARAALFDRRTYELLEPVYGPKDGPAYDPAKPGPFVCVAVIETSPENEEDLNRWYEEEHMALIAKVPGWVRTRRCVLVSSAAMGSEAKGEKPAKFLALHEMEDMSVLETSDEFKAAAGTEWSKKVISNATVFHVRMFKVLSTWEGPK